MKIIPNGCKVTVKQRKELASEFPGRFISINMEILCEKTVTIQYSDVLSDGSYYYRIKEDGGHYYWDNGMFDLISIKFPYDKNVIFVVTYEENYFMIINQGKLIDNEIYKTISEIEECYKNSIIVKLYE